MLNDLVSTRGRLACGQSSPAAELQRCLAAADGPDCAHVFRRLCSDQAAATGVERLPLAGLAVSVKDLFDIEGLPTTAGSTVLADAPPAQADSPAWPACAAPAVPSWGTRTWWSSPSPASA